MMCFYFVQNLTEEEPSPDTIMYSVSSVKSKKENGYIINTYAYKRKNEVRIQTMLLNLLNNI